MAGCVFCRILGDDDPTVLVYRDRQVAAFLDKRPLFPGHLLAVPVDHVATLDEAEPDLLVSLFGLVQESMRALYDEIGAEGTFVASNNVVSQSVPHLHVHVVPRRRGDGLRGFFWPRNGYDSEAQRADLQARLRRRLA